MAVNIAGMLCLHAYRIDDERIGDIDVTRVVLKCVYVVYIFMRIGIAFAIAAILMALTVIINLAATLIGKYYDKRRSI